MTSELSVLLRAGLPLDRALKVLIDMDGQPRMRAVLSELLKSVKGGKALSIALQPFERHVWILSISVWCEQGRPVVSYRRCSSGLVEHLESAKATRDSVVSAMIYPGDFACGGGVVDRGDVGVCRASV